MSNDVITYREGTTRIVEITCLDQDRKPFDFEGYTVQVSVMFLNYTNEETKTYLSASIENNVVTFEVPASLSVGMAKGEYEVRIFKNEEVVSVIYGKFTILKSHRPDIEYHGGEE